MTGKSGNRLSGQRGQGTRRPPPWVRGGAQDRYPAVSWRNEQGENLARHTLILCVALLMATACQPSEQPAAPARSEPGPADPDAPAAEPTSGPETPQADPATVGANELGQIPVIMHHRTVEGGGGEYDRSPEEFRAELSRLYEGGYRPVRTIDVVRGMVDVPAGTTPVVLTFDDSSSEQFALTPDDEVDPDSAIGMLMDFADDHDDFNAVASLYINAGPFGVSDTERMLTWLHEHGFELGNHTHGHANLAQVGHEKARQELALGARVITDHVPDAEVVTLSLPLGIWPDPRDIAYAGEFEGDEYHHEGVLLVGAGPAPSPFSSEFDPLAIPRIRSSAWEGGEPNFGSDFWLDWFDDNPDRRYVSDGDPNRISFPADLADDLAPDYADSANPY